MRADRLVSLVLLLQARGRTTAGVLAREVGVSVRTVYRDLEALSAAGVPVLAEAGPGGGCQLLDGFRLPLRGLRPEEAEALLILGVPAPLRDLGLDAAAVSAQRSIAVSAARPGDSGGAAPGSPLVHLDMPRWFASEEQLPQLRTLAEALRRGQQLEFRYAREPAAGGDDASPKRAGAPRVAAPLGLVNKAGIWYLVAASAGGQPRVFRAGRVTGARLLPRPVTRPDSFDLAAFWARWSREFAASRPRTVVRLAASPDVLAALPYVFGHEVHPAIDAALPPDEHGWRELTLWFDDERAAAHRLAGFGGGIRVLEPDAVRERLLATARGILAVSADAAGSTR